MFIMLDGIDGSGKSTILNYWKEEIVNSGNAIFDLKKYWLDTGRYPDLSEIKAYDFIFSCEPTYTGIGNVIRDELVKDNAYPAEATAEAFSLDRLILYHKIIIPLLKDNKCIIQDRGLSSSLAYQTTQSNNLTDQYILNLPGNILALKYRPDYLVLSDLSPDKAIQRIDDRTGKKDEAIFEKLDFLTLLDIKYKSSDFRSHFINASTEIIDLPTDTEIDIMKEQSISLLRRILNNK